jgi:hypothetical protein
MHLIDVSTYRLLGMRTACRVFQSYTARSNKEGAALPDTPSFNSDDVYHRDDDLGPGDRRRGGFEGCAHIHKPGEFHDGTWCDRKDCWSLTEILIELATRPHMPNKKERAAIRKEKARKK